jgi:two-component system phosphate regulon sensor histidine kinase PhoR
MASEHLQHIFKKFHRISTGNVQDVKGFGIGLFYVKTIVEAHGGNIKVNSEPGKGSKFTLFFPFKNPGLMANNE